MPVSLGHWGETVYRNWWVFSAAPGEFYYELGGKEVHLRSPCIFFNLLLISLVGLFRAPTSGLSQVLGSLVLWLKTSNRKVDSSQGLKFKVRPVEAETCIHLQVLPGKFLFSNIDIPSIRKVISDLCISSL